MASKQKNNKLFIDPEEAIEILRELVETTEAEDADLIFYDKVKDITDRVKPPKLGLASIDAAITNLLKRYEQANPNGGGLSMPFIWKTLKAGGDPVTNVMVEQSLAKLLEEGKIHKVINGLTYYKLGANPEAESNPDLVRDEVKTSG